MIYIELNSCRFSYSGSKSEGRSLESLLHKQQINGSPLIANYCPKHSVVLIRAINDHTSASSSLCVREVDQEKEEEEVGRRWWTMTIKFANNSFILEAIDRGKLVLFIRLPFYSFARVSCNIIGSSSGISCARYSFIGLQSSVRKVPSFLLEVGTL